MANAEKSFETQKPTESETCEVLPSSTSENSNSSTEANGAVAERPSQPPKMPEHQVAEEATQFEPKTPKVEIEESHSPPPLEEICFRPSSPDFESGEIIEVSSPVPPESNVSAPQAPVSESPIQTSTMDQTPVSCSTSVQTPQKISENPDDDDQPLDQLDTLQQEETNASVTEPRPPKVIARKSPENGTRGSNIGRGRLVASVCIPTKQKMTKPVTSEKKPVIVMSQQKPLASKPIPRPVIQSSPTESPEAQAQNVPRNVLVHNNHGGTTSPMHNHSNGKSSRPQTTVIPVAKKVACPVKPATTSPLKTDHTTPTKSPSPKSIVGGAKGLKAINLIGRTVFTSCKVKSKTKPSTSGRPSTSEEVAESPPLPKKPSPVTTPVKNGNPSNAIPTVKAVTSIIRPAPVSVIHKNPTHNIPPSPPPQQQSSRNVRPIINDESVSAERVVRTATVHSIPRYQSNSSPIDEPNQTPPLPERPAPKPMPHPVSNQQCRPTAQQPQRSKVIHQKYPPPTPVEGLQGQSKWPAIKTIKMANGETCGIKVQSPSVFTKVNIPNAKLREVKQQIAAQEAKKKRSRDYRVSKPTYHTGSHPSSTRAPQPVPLHRSQGNPISVPINSMPPMETFPPAFPPTVPALPPPPVRQALPPPTTTNSSDVPAAPQQPTTPTKTLSQNFLARYSGKIVGTAKLKNDKIKSPTAKTPPAKSPLLEKVRLKVISGPSRMNASFQSSI